MTSTRPYLIRAFYEWIIDNQLTPHLVVNADHRQAAVPSEYVENGRIVLNISPSAVQSLDLGNEWISFNARFSQQSREIGLPPAAVLGIYARENGQGMMFQDEPPGEDDPTHPAADQHTGKGGSGSRPSLKVVK